MRFSRSTGDLSSTPSHATTPALIQHLADRFLEFGYHLQVAPQVVGYVTRAVTVGPYTGGAASAAGWIRAAVELALIRMLEDGAQPGDAWVLAVDDLSLPGPPKGMWRE